MGAVQRFCAEGRVMVCCSLRVNTVWLVDDLLPVVGGCYCRGTYGMCGVMVGGRGCGGGSGVGRDGTAGAAYSPSS